MPQPNLTAFAFDDVAAEIAEAAAELALMQDAHPDAWRFDPGMVREARGYLAGLRMATSMLVPLEEGEL